MKTTWMYGEIFVRFTLVSEQAVPSRAGCDVHVYRSLWQCKSRQISFNGCARDRIESFPYFSMPLCLECFGVYMKNLLKMKIIFIEENGKKRRTTNTYIVDQHQIVHQDKSVRLHDLVLDPFGRDQTNTSLD